jgi:hypothetical protein
VLYPGCQFSFNTTIDNKKNIDNVVFGFQINKEDGTPVVALHNKIYGQKISILPFKNGAIRVLIPCFPLVQSGIYSIDLFLGERMENFDIVRRAAIVKVDSSKTKTFIAPVIESLNLMYIEDISFDLVK